jgi:hypothetical protein
LCFCLPDCRYNANKLTRKFTIQTVQTHAWAVPSLGMLPQVGKGAHVFHCWLGSARVIEIHEVRGWLGQLTDHISRFHVRRIPATARIEPYSSTCVRLARCKAHTGRSAFPKPTRSRLARPSWRMCGAALSAATRSHAPSFLLVRIVHLEPAMPFEATDGLHTKVYCPVSEQPYRHLDGTRAPDGMARSPRRPRPLSLPAEPILRCCSIASSTARNAVQRCGGRRG